MSPGKSFGTQGRGGGFCLGTLPGGVNYIVTLIQPISKRGRPIKQLPSIFGALALKGEKRGPSLISSTFPDFPRDPQSDGRGREEKKNLPPNADLLIYTSPTNTFSSGKTKGKKKKDSPKKHYLFWPLMPELLEEEKGEERRGPFAMKSTSCF